MASRRASEELIQAGRVCVNGALIRQLGAKVDAARDTVTVDGKPVRTRRKLYVALHKPPGVVCSRKDERARPTVYDLLRPEWRNLHPVGRLDYDSEGLLFLTNDGGFTLHLTHPRTAAETLSVTVAGRVTAAMRALDARIWHDGSASSAAPGW